MNISHLSNIYNLILKLKNLLIVFADDKLLSADNLHKLHPEFFGNAAEYEHTKLLNSGMHHSACAEVTLPW